MLIVDRYLFSAEELEQPTARACERSKKNRQFDERHELVASAHLDETPPDEDAA